jgi:hypothetical protein
MISKEFYAVKQRKWLWIQIDCIYILIGMNGFFSNVIINFLIVNTVNGIFIWVRNKEEKIFLFFPLHWNS